MQAAVRFRHAVRGRWDAVDALHDGPPGTFEGLQKDAVGSRLPHISMQSASPDKQDKLLRASLWADEISSLCGRQRRHNWHDSHRPWCRRFISHCRDTLSNWSKSTWFENRPHSLPSEASHMSLRGMHGSISLPDLTSAQPLATEFMERLTQEDVESKNASRLFDLHQANVSASVLMLNFVSAWSGRERFERFGHIPLCRVCQAKSYCTSYQKR